MRNQFGFEPWAGCTASELTEGFADRPLRCHSGRRHGRRYGTSIENAYRRVIRGKGVDGRAAFFILSQSGERPER
jgi:hypothetical protein